MFKKMMLVSLLLITSYASDTWETGWAMGTSSYSLFNDKNEQLLIECSDAGANIYLNNQNGGEIPIHGMLMAEINGVPYETITEVNEETIPEGRVVWDNFIGLLPDAKKVSILASRGTIKFEPSNSNEIVDIVESCKAQPLNNDTYSQDSINIDNSVPLQISISQQPNDLTHIPVTILHLVGLRDKAFKIHEIIVNKGNCKVTSYGIGKLDDKLSYGQEITIPLVANSMCQNILEIEIKTDAGSYIFEN